MLVMVLMDGFGLHSNGFYGGHGGASYSTGTLNIINSDLYNNYAGDGGDGVALVTEEMEVLVVPSTTLES
jgi:hypothetical protein